MNFQGKILLVDDEDHIRKYLSLVVRGLGAPTVFEAANGTDALAIAAREKPDLILLDVNMPGIDGIDTLRALRPGLPDCTIIMLTSLANRQTVEDALAAGADHYLRKDASRDELLRLITEHLTGDPPSDA